MRYLFEVERGRVPESQSRQSLQLHCRIPKEFVQITVDLNLSEDDKNQLADVLGSSNDDVELQTTLRLYAQAALLEYVNGFLGQTSLTRGSDTREYRLFLLMKEVFKEQIPDEQKISELFHITLPQSKTLIKAVISKNRYDLKETIKASLIKTIRDGKLDDNKDCETSIKNLIIVDELNYILALKDGTLPKILRKPRTVSTYIIKASSYEAISSYLEIA
jgi:hypothetical protein